MSVYVIFWDGVGYGVKNPAANPFFSAYLPALATLCGSELFSLRHRHVSGHPASVSPVNATLGIAGLPQSGTGQTALFTGVNASKTVGRHFGPYPYSTLVPIIRTLNIFAQLNALGARTQFANGFPVRYIEYLAAHRSHTPVVALAYSSVNGALHTHEDVMAGTALSADIVGSRWKELGHAGIDEVRPEDAGRRFFELGTQFDFILFEYFITDKAGHSQDHRTAVEALERVDRFVDGLMTGFDFLRDTLILISDHGNIEDLTTRSHTRNPVPLIAAGKGKEDLSRSVTRLTDFTPAVAALVRSNLR